MNDKLNRKMLLFIFMIVIVVSITISMDMTFAQKQEDDKYNFVHCPNDNNIYPEGTQCDTISDNFDDDNNNNNKEINEDEEKAMKEGSKN